MCTYVRVDGADASLPSDLHEYEPTPTVVMPLNGEKGNERIDQSGGDAPTEENVG